MASTVIPRSGLSCAIVLLLFFLAGCGGSGTKEADEGRMGTTVEQTAQQHQEEEHYMPVSAGEIGASMDLQGSVRWDSEGRPRFGGPGSIESFSCWGHPIDLTSDQFEDGFICTKEYGKIKIRCNPDFTFRMEITPSQKAALMELKGKEQ